MEFLTRENGVYLFGPFRLDPVRRSLTRGEERIKLTARLFETLLYLVENHERLVERDELQRAVWRGRSVDEANLGQAISTLRKTLRNAGGEESYIVTVAGRGYRFGAPVATESDPPHGARQTPDAAGPVSPPSGASRHSRWAWLFVALAVGALGVAGWRMVGQGSQTALSRPSQALAQINGHKLENSRLTFVFGSSSTGYTTGNADRVDAIVWLDSNGRPISNYIAQADRFCDDAIEYFGQAYGNGVNTRPYAVIGGTASAWSGRSALTSRTTVTSLSSCSFSLDASAATRYALFDDPALVNAVMIARTIRFTASAPNGDMRAYVVRVPASSYPYVIYPDGTGTLHTVHDVTCDHNCVIANWNGKWMADDSGKGQGIAIFRKPNAALPAEITVDYDDDSASNASAITLIEPREGWSGKVITETEYLCFYDAKSWSAAERAAGAPPTGCADVLH